MARKRAAKQEEPEPSDEEVMSEEEEVQEPETPKVKKSKAQATKSKKAPAKKSKTEDSDEVENEGGNGKRFFKILLDKVEPQGNSPPVNEKILNNGGGRYTGKNPMQAAKKAFTRICRNCSPDKGCSYVFVIQETTGNSAKKSFVYRGVRKELDEPEEVKKGDTTYLIRFSCEVKSHKSPSTTTTSSNKKATPKKAAEKKPAPRKRTAKA